MKRKINWYAIIHEIFNIACCCKRYDLDLGNFNSGERKQFWLKRKALKIFKKYANEKSGYATVTLYDNFYKPNNGGYGMGLTIKRWQSKKWDEIKTYNQLQNLR